MVDIHCHILPGLDDGPDSIEESLEMAQAAIADGITHVVATPHANDMFTFDPAMIGARREELQALVGDKLRLATGCDFHLSFENIQAAREEPKRFTINQKNYLLVEFADFAIPPTMDQTLQELLGLGLFPVITHPERNPLLRAHRERVNGWVQMGCLVQITAQSVLGRFGQSAQKATDAWLEENGVHFFASDAHDVKNRPLRLREAYDVVAQRKGAAVADALFRGNPLAAFEGRPLPYLPEPEEPKKKKKFLFF